jgi:hypothetical protein
VAPSSPCWRLRKWPETPRACPRRQTSCWGIRSDGPDRHVELAGRLEWLSSVLTHNEPPEGQSRRDRNLTRSSVASEHADEFGSDEWLHDQILAVVMLATDLDYESREHAYSIVPLSWWAERTEGLAAEEALLDASLRDTETESAAAEEMH